AAEKKRAVVDRLDLGTAAGLHLRPGTLPGRLPSPVSAAPDAASAPAEFPSREQIEAALRRLDGNVTRAAHELGVHRNQLRRWLARNEVAGRAPVTLPGSSPPRRT